MVIISSDKKRIVNIGSSVIWKAVVSTIHVRATSQMKNVDDAVHFIDTGICEENNAMQTARQINLIRDKLATVPPEKVVYDENDLKKKAPWEANISPVITSCANYFTTADGKDLLFEIVCILCYSGITGVKIAIE